MPELSLEEMELKARLGAFNIFDMGIFVPEVKKLRPGQVYLEIGVDRGKSLSIEELREKRNQLNAEVSERLIELRVINQAISELMPPPIVVLEFNPEIDL